MVVIIIIKMYTMEEQHRPKISFVSRSAVLSLAVSPFRNVVMISLAVLVPRVLIN